MEYIDHIVHSILDSTSEIFPMDKYFATLPPRICQIDLEGLTYYKNHELSRKFLRYDIEECILDGSTMKAEVQGSGQVLIWNERFPKEKFPCGINARFHAEKHLGAMSYAPQLPPQGCERKAGFVVHSKSDADIWLQFPSPIYNHHFRTN